MGRHTQWPSATTSGGRRRRLRRFLSEPLEALEVGEPDLHQRADRLLQPGVPRGGERLLVALTHLRRVDALLEPVVARHEELLDPLPGSLPLHKRSVTGHIYVST